MGDRCDTFGRGRLELEPSRTVGSFGNGSRELYCRNTTSDPNPPRVLASSRGMLLRVVPTFVYPHRNFSA